MLTAYLEAAMRSAHYELLPDDGQFYGAIPPYTGVYATAATLEECREQLREVLEEWVLFRVRRNVTLPVVAGVELAVKAAAV